MAEYCAAEILPPLEDADVDMMIADEYFNNRQASDSEHEDDSCRSGDEDRSGDTSNIRRKSFMDPREVDLVEIREVKEFSSAACKCSKRKGGSCGNYFSVEEFADYRMQMAELEHDALDIVILSQINAHHFFEDLEGH